MNVIGQIVIQIAENGEAQVAVQPQFDPQTVVFYLERAKAMMLAQPVAFKSNGAGLVVPQPGDVNRFGHGPN